ncbi:MAG TPA: HAMP domain-containing sensor histidine kinase [Roseiflexaceae bacterium]|nr:HAMP domain-containing sensor histidine kinase [Roseiflexaceae bacterium]
MPSVKRVPDSYLALQVIARKRPALRRVRRDPARLRASNNAGRRAVMPAWHAEMIDGLIHDMRNMLAVIRGNAQLIEYQALNPSRSPRISIEARLAAIAEAIDQLDGQIAQLDYRSKQTARTPVELVELARRCAMVYNRSDDTRSIVVETAEAAIVGNWAQVGLTCVLDNLVSNALKYSPDGTTVTIRLSTESSLQRRAAVVRICDQGIGIPEEALPRIFESHYRAPNVPPGVQGQGMGLANVRRLVAAEDGTVSVESRVGQGTCFTVRLPLPVALDTLEESMTFAHLSDAGRPLGIQ